MKEALSTNAESGFSRGFLRFARTVVLVSGANSLLIILSYLEDKSTFSVMKQQGIPASSLSSFFPFPVILLFGFVLGLLYMVGGIGILKRRNWGQRLLLYLSWVLILYALAFSIYFQIFITNNMPSLFDSSSDFLIYMRIASIVISLLSLYAVYALIRYIQRNKLTLRASRKKPNVIVGLKEGGA